MPLREHIRLYLPELSSPITVIVFALNFNHMEKRTNILLSSMLTWNLNCTLLYILKDFGWQSLYHSKNKYVPVVVILLIYFTT